MQQVEVAVIGTGWCGGIRAETLSRSSIVDKLHICEIRLERLAEVEVVDGFYVGCGDGFDREWAGDASAGVVHEWLVINGFLARRFIVGDRS